MKAKELLATILSCEDDANTEYDHYCIGDIDKDLYEKKSKKIAKEQINLIDLFQKELLSDFLDFLLKKGYCDTDVYSEPPTAIDQYLIFNNKPK